VLSFDPGAFWGMAFRPRGEKVGDEPGEGKGGASA